MLSEFRRDPASQFKRDKNGSCQAVDPFEGKVILDVMLNGTTLPCMKTEILQNVMSKIAVAARDGDIAEVQRLTPIAARLRQLIDQKQLLEKEGQELVERVSSPNARPING